MVRLHADHTFRRVESIAYRLYVAVEPRHLDGWL